MSGKSGAPSSSWTSKILAVGWVTALKCDSPSAKPPRFLEDHVDWGFLLFLSFYFVLTWAKVPLILSFGFTFLLIVPLHVVFEVTPLDQVLQII